MSKAQQQCQIQISMSASRGVTSSQLHRDANTLPSPCRTSGNPFGGFLGPDVNTTSSSSFAPFQPAFCFSRAHQHSS